MLGAILKPLQAVLTNIILKLEKFDGRLQNCKSLTGYGVQPRVLKDGVAGHARNIMLGVEDALIDDCRVQLSETLYFQGWKFAVCFYEYTETFPTGKSEETMEDSKVKYCEVLQTRADDLETPIKDGHLPLGFGKRSTCAQHYLRRISPSEVKG